MALVNGQGYDFASLVITMLGNPLVAGFKAIEYNTTRAKQNNHGAQGLPVERTRGQKNFAGSVTLSMKEVKLIREAAGKIPLTDIPPFPITVSYANGVDAITTDILEFCEFTEDNVSVSDGDMMIDIVLPLVIGGISYNR